MGSNQPAKVSKEQVQEANAMWQGFTTVSKYSIIGICASLLLLALILL